MTCWMTGKALRHKSTNEDLERKKKNKNRNRPDMAKIPFKNIVAKKTVGHVTKPWETNYSVFLRNDWD